MAPQFEGRVAVVTGGNSGIGRATAIRFAQEGAKVVVAARRIQQGEETVEEIRRAGGEALFVRTDVSRAGEVESMVSQAVEAYGRLDFAFNNAGTSTGGPMHEATEEDWDRVVDVNLKGVWLCMKFEIAQMLAQSGGAIVNVSSVAGLVGEGNAPIYAASKFGVVGLTRSSALQYAKSGIRINAVCPGAVLTPMLRAVFDRRPEAEESFLAHEPIGRFGEPNEIAEAVVWLCSDTASFVTGVAMPVDGGTVAGLW